MSLLRAAVPEYVLENRPAMHKRLQMFALGMVATLLLASPAFAALQLVAPSAVHDLLLSHLPLAGPEGEPQDATARSTLERRLIKEAGGFKIYQAQK